MIRAAHKNLLSLLTILICAISLSACVESVVVATAAGVVYVSKRETTKDIIEDSSIKTNVLNTLNKDPQTSSIANNIDIAVFQGRVLVVAETKSAEVKQFIIKTISAQKGVKEVIDEIKVSDSVSNASISDSAKSIGTQTAIRLRSLLSTVTQTKNYDIIVRSKVVYILGVASSVRESSNISVLASKTAGVEKVVNYLKIQKYEQ